MFSKLFAAAALAVVSAADVPLFSSNDDYDEINLNIRMLSNVTSAAVETTIAAAVKVTANFPQMDDGTGTMVDATPALLFLSAQFQAGCVAALQATDALSGASTITITGVTAAAARARARALSTTQLALDIAYSAVFPSATAAATAVTNIAAVASGAAASAFETQLAGDLASKLAAANFNGGTLLTGLAVTSKGGSVQTGGGAAAAPSPSPSSNAAKVAVSTLAAFAAFMASLM